MVESERWDGWLGPKQWMPIVGVLSVAVIALGVLLFLNTDDDEEPGGSTGAGRAPTHEHANVALFIRGQQFDFDKPEFMISEGETPKSDNVHLHEPRSSVVHVHTTLTTWDEFFTSIGFRLTDPSFPGIDSARTCMTLPDGTKLCNTATETWKFVANGVQADGLSNVNIGELDRILFSFGTESVEQVLSDQFSKVATDACIVSELCLARGTPEDEPCVGRDQCIK